MHDPGIAVSCGSLVGLDVEETRRHTKADPLKLARRRLAPLELADLEGGFLACHMLVCRARHSCELFCVCVY